jgi:DNA-binding MarR family transcriptional regulator
MAIPTATIGERIMVHLSQYVRHQDAFVCPPGMSQGGIAISLGISRAHAAIELRRAMDAGRVTVRTAHVTGASSRRKVYALTHQGRNIAASVRGRALSVTTELFLPGGTRETVDGRRAYEMLRGHGIPEGRALLLLLTRERIDVEKVIRLRLAAKERAGSPVEALAAEIFQQAFVRPVAWQFEVILGPPHVPPFPAGA